MANKKEVMHLVGDFRPAVLARWEQWAAINNYTIKRIADFDWLQGKENLLIILDEHGLNDLHI